LNLTKRFRFTEEAKALSKAAKGYQEKSLGDTTSEAFNGPTMEGQGNRKKPLPYPWTTDYCTKKVCRFHRYIHQGPLLKSGYLDIARTAGDVAMQK